MESKQNSGTPVLTNFWHFRTPIPIVDKEGHVVVLLTGRPADENWDEVQEAVVALLKKIHIDCPEFDEGCHRRGDFPTLRCGVSHGQGHTQPMNFVNCPMKQCALEELNSHPSFVRIAGFMNCMPHAFCTACMANIPSAVLATWAPKLHEHYVKNITSLFSHDNTLSCPFPWSIFPATTYNLGPQTTCTRHFNFANLAYSWCGIAALGRFDPMKGGHLVLWELGLVVEFPPGSIVLIPSAVVSHSNTPIMPHEARYSVMQYTAGGIFRWVDCNFWTKETYLKSLKAKERAEMVEGGSWAVSSLTLCTRNVVPINYHSFFRKHWMPTIGKGFPPMWEYLRGLCFWAAHAR